MTRTVEERKLHIGNIVKYHPPCFIVTSGQQEIPFLTLFCEQEGIPLLRTSETTTDFIAKLDGYLVKALAPEISIHGVCVNVSGIGILLVITSYSIHYTKLYDTPVKGENDKVLGVLTGLVDFEAFMEKYTEDLYINDGAGYPIVVDSKGIIQLHPNEELIGKTIGESGVPQELGNILQSQGTSSGSTTYQDEGKTFIVVYAPMAQTGYGLYLHLPQKVITEQVDAVKST